MRPTSSPPRNRTHDRKHQKKKFSRSRSTKPNKLNLISALPDFQLNSLHHLFKYDRVQSRADKSSAGSNHNSKHKHHSVCHLNPTSAIRRDSPIKKKRGGVVDSASTKSILKSCKRSPTLPTQQAYAVKVKKDRDKMFNRLEKIPEAKNIREWNRQSKSKFVPDPLPPVPSRPVIPSLFFNPFKFKRGRRPERKPKKDNTGTAKKVKGRAQPLGLHEQQICIYHNPPIEYPPTYPGDEPVMAITADPIPLSRSKIPSVSPSTQPSLVAVSIDEPEPIPDEEVELEKLVESSDSDLDEVIRFGSLCSVMIPETFLSCGISTADVNADNPVHHIDLDTLQDDKTVVAGSKTINLNKLDTTLFYDDSPRAQMDGGARVSVTNLVSILHSVQYFDAKFKSRVRMHGATSKEIITPRAVGFMRVRALVSKDIWM